MEGINFKEIDRFKLSRYREFVYIDIISNAAASIFLSGRVNIRVKNVYERENEKYVFVDCLVPKKHIQPFEKAMSKLADNLRVRGYTDYENNCVRLFQELESV